MTWIYMLVAFAVGYLCGMFAMAAAAASRRDDDDDER